MHTCLKIKDIIIQTRWQNVWSNQLSIYNLNPSIEQKLMLQIMRFDRLGIFIQPEMGALRIDPS